ncbi:MAG TPA: DOPA 4,5-dioxygenase family protein [Rhizomicrobium sp.]
MTATAIAERAIEGFHAHVYYVPATKPVAEHVRLELGRRFPVVLGRWHDVPVGPHDQAMYQVAFAPEQFARVVPWLMLHREGLSILVHPLTGDDYEDHATHSLWLGAPLRLRLEVLRDAHAGDD